MTKNEYVPRQLVRGNTVMRKNTTKNEGVIHFQDVLKISLHNEPRHLKKKNYL